MKKSEFIKIKFLGFEMECKDPSKRGFIIIAMVLMFLLVVLFFSFHLKTT